MKILIVKKLFDKSWEIAWSNFQKWCQDLDPGNTQQFDTRPEVAYLARDNSSKNSNSYTSHSISSMLSFEIEKMKLESKVQ